MHNSSVCIQKGFETFLSFFRKQYKTELEKCFKTLLTNLMCNSLFVQANCRKRGI